MSCSKQGLAFHDEPVPNDPDMQQLLALISLRIKRERLRQNCSQEEVMGRVIADVRLLQRFEAKAFPNSNPKLGSIIKVARALGMNLDDLFKEASAEELCLLAEADFPERIKKNKQVTRGKQ